ncbi:MAG TPA: hypothetical protein VGL40_06880 [Bacillota bacterium]
MFQGITLITAAAVAAAIHALAPDHWLPYVLLAKGRGWPLARALQVTAVGAVSHLASTTILGFVIVFLGAGATERFGRSAELYSSLLVIALGVYLLWAGRRGRGHHHEHGHHHQDHSEAHAHREHDRRSRSDLSLGALLGARPCAESIPIFIAASTWGVFTSLGAVAAWAVVTIGAMLTAVWLSLLGLGAVRLEFLERHGEALSAWLIIMIGVIVLALAI